MEVRRASEYPDHEVLIGNPSEQYKIIGNSVDRHVARALGLCLRESWTMSNTRPPPTIDASSPKRQGQPIRIRSSSPRVLIPRYKQVDDSLDQYYRKPSSDTGYCSTPSTASLSTQNWPPASSATPKASRVSVLNDPAVVLSPPEDKHASPIKESTTVSQPMINLTSSDPHTRFHTPEVSSQAALGMELAVPFSSNGYSLTLIEQEPQATALSPTSQTRYGSPRHCGTSVEDYFVDAHSWQTPSVIGEGTSLTPLSIRSGWPVISHFQHAPGLATDDRNAADVLSPSSRRKL